MPRDRNIITYAKLISENPQFNIASLRGEMKSILSFIVAHKQDLIDSVEKHNRPPIEGVIKELEVNYDETFSRIQGTQSDMLLKQAIGKIIAYVMNNEGYVATKRSGILKNLLSKYFSSTSYFERKTPD